MKIIELFNCQLSDDALAALSVPFSKGQLAAGQSVGYLEQAISERFPNSHIVALNDMTHGLALALRLANVNPGDEVLTLSFNCMSSNAAITMMGASPIWIDVEPKTATFDLNHARQSLTSRTKAVIIYHISGYPADLRAIRKFCDENKLILIEDANNAFGANIDDIPVGTVGDYAIFSLYANRQINAIDGAILLCRKEKDAKQAKRIRRFGIDLAKFRDQDGEISPFEDIREIGTSAALNNINATLALHSLQSVDNRLAQSRENIDLLIESTKNLAIKPVMPLSGSNPSYWTWLILLENRDYALRALKKRGVMCSKLHFPNHHYSGFNALSVELPGTQILEEQLLAIPCGWWVDKESIKYIVSEIEKVLRTSL